MTRARLRLDWSLCALVALAAMIRFATLAQQSLWLDEAITALRVLHPSLSATFSAVVHNENTPPAFYFAEWFLTRALGSGVFALRTLSAIGGVATVAVAWTIGRELGSRGTAVTLAAIVATNPLFVWYSQEARAYELFVFFAAVAFLYFLRARARPTATNVVVWALASSLSLATHYFAAFLIAPEVALLLTKIGRDRRLLVAIGAVGVVGLALVPLVLVQGGRGTDWIGNWPLGGRVQAIGYYYLLGESGHPLGRVVEWAALLPILATIALAFTLDRSELRPALLCTAVGGAAILVPVALALLGLDYLAPRYLIAAWVPLSAALAVLLTARSTVLTLILALLICAAAVSVDAAVVVLARLQRGNWHWAAENLGGSTDRAVVILTLGGLPLEYYEPALQHASNGQVRVREVDVVGYEPLRPSALQPPVPGFVAVGRAENHGLVVLRYSAPRPVLVPMRRLLGARADETPTEVLAPASARIETAAPR
jgi:mannosyltransferase